MCEEPHDLLHQNQQLTFRNKEFHNSMCLTFIVSVMKDTEVISAVFNLDCLFDQTARNIST